MSKGEGNTENLAVRILSNNLFTVWCANHWNAGDNYQTSTNAWYYWVFSMATSSGYQSTLSTYVNTGAVSNMYRTTASPGVLADRMSHPLTIGARNLNSNSEYFHGFVYRLDIFQQETSGNEIWSGCAGGCALSYCPESSDCMWYGVEFLEDQYNNACHARC